MATSVSVDRQSARERKDRLTELLTTVVGPQRRRLLRARDHTWQSAYVDDDGYLAELIGAIVVGTPGTARRGVSRTTGDLRDGTEVKKGYRLDPNIDFVLQGKVTRVGRALALRVGELPPELRLADIVTQINSNASSVQLLENLAPGEIGTALWRTATGDALGRDDRDGAAILRFGSGTPPLALDKIVRVCVRQERGHINFGKKTRAQLEGIIRSRPILVFYQHDLRGRMSIAVVRISMTEREIRTYLDQAYARGTAACQIQPYLFPDNVRGGLYADSIHSVRDGLRGRLLAYCVEGPTGFRIPHWEVDDPPLVRDCESTLLAQAAAGDCPPFQHPRLRLDWSDPGERREFAADFFNEAIVGYNRGLQPFCELASCTRNIGLGNLSQHLASLCTGLRGTRSGARGKDLVEPDGVTPSEVKLATGQSGDTMGTEDMPRLTLGWDHDSMRAWKRLIAVRLIEYDAGHGPRWRAMVHAPTRDTMATFREQVAQYFSGRVFNGSGGLQYHARAYPHDDYGTEDHRLVFARVGQFEEGKPALFPNELPDW